MHIQIREKTQHDPHTFTATIGFDGGNEHTLEIKDPFADDPKLYGGVRTVAGRTSLQSDLSSLAEWSLRWMLPFNPEKCSTLHLGPRNPGQAYSILGFELSQPTTEKDLGVIIDGDLKFRQQASSAVNKANRVLGLIRHSFANLDEKTLPMLFKIFVRPHLEYGNTIWGPFNQADAKLVERVQRRATKLVPGLRNVSYEERLRRLRLPSLQYRRRRGDMILLFRIMHGLTCLKKADFFEDPRTDRTRGHSLRVAKPSAVTRVRRNHFSIRAVNDWNSLPEEVVSASSVNAFKNSLDEFWRDVHYDHPN